MTKRTYWYAPSFRIKNEPLMKSLIEYRRKKDRWRIPDDDMGSDIPNLVSSITDDGRHMPILDLDFDHAHVESHTEGHAHLYLDRPISKVRWLALMTGLYLGGVIELGFYVWSLRRGANFVRLPGTEKDMAESQKPDYGWFFRLRKR